MDLNEKYQDWEDEAPELAKISRSNPFLTPSGYFRQLEESIQGRVILESLNLDQEPGFKVEAEYFDSLPQKIEASVALQELKEEMKSEGFTVPLGYFDELNEKISRRIERPEAKIRKLVPGWMRYAAAASIAIAVAVGLLVKEDAQVAGTDLSAVPEQQIINYLELYSDPMDNQVIVENMEPGAFSEVSDDVSTQELKYYLEDTSL